jgi:hypothetical protein
MIMAGVLYSRDATPEVGLMTNAPKTESLLREKARSAVEKGNLPGRPPDRTWGGLGVGATCAVCELLVTKDQMEIEVEVEFPHDGSAPRLDKYHLHVLCFAAWEFERARATKSHQAIR